MSQGSGAGLCSCEDKVAVVTGAAGLLGRAVCDGLRAAGAQVWAADVADIRPGEQTLVMDITDEASIRQALDNIVSASGRLDIVVNSAYPRTSDWGDPSRR